MQWTEIAVAIAAIYAAAVATWNLVARISSRVPKLRVRAEHSLPWDPAWPCKFMVTLSAANAGGVPVEVRSCGLSLPDRRKLVFPEAPSDRKLPCTLPVNESCTLFVWAQDIAVALQREGLSGTVVLHPFFTDSMDRVYRGPALEFDIEQWLREAERK